MPSGCQDESYIEDLAVRYLDGDLTPKEFDAFDGRLQHDGEARRAFIDLCLDATAIREIQDAALAKILQGAAEDVPRDPNDDRSEFGFDGRPSSWPEPPLVFGAISFASIFLLISGLVAFLFLSPRPDPATNLSDYVARVSSVSGDCRHADTGAPVRSGERLLEHAKLRLASGGAHVTFRSGASVVLDGPSDFDVLDPNSGHLVRGHLLGKIPGADASGFSISTPDAHIVDLGTEFSVHVGNDTPTSVEVFDGRVRLASRIDASVARLLEVGERVRLAPNRIIPEEPRGKPSFARVLIAPHRLETAVLAENPVAYWRFEHAGDSPIIPDASGNGYHGVKRNGARVSAIDGIAGGALVLDGIDDYLDIPISPELENAEEGWTIVGWINITDTSKEHPLVTVLLESDEAITPSWTIFVNSDGAIEGESGGRPWEPTRSPVAVDDLRDGRWRQIALVVDRENGERRVYVDGKAAGKSPIGAVAGEKPRRLKNSLRIGTCSESDCAEGYVDEVVLFSRVLPDETIAALYEAAAE